jgi:hypothetical protein
MMSRRELLQGSLAAASVMPAVGAEAASQAGTPARYDLVVYGATAAGVITAISAARHGLKVALAEPRHYVGGMVSGGLSGTDVGRREVIGGMALEFYFRAGRYYELDRHLQEIAWQPEPKVAERIFREWLAEAGVELLERHRLQEKTGVRKQGSRIVEIVMENGARLAARVFADASYEGDLMAQAGVRYTVGREGIAQYGESLAGVRAVTPHHQFPVPISAYDEQGRLLPEISPEPRGEPGSGDHRVQAYNFRVIATNVPENRVPWPKPDNYDPWRYELLARYLAALTKYLGRSPTFNEVSLLRRIPNGKVDVNNRGGFSSDYIGKNYRYPDGSYAERERIWRDHEEYQKGFYYFLATIRGCRRSFSRKCAVTGWPKMSFSTPVTGPTSFTFVRRVAWWASSWPPRRTCKPIAPSPTSSAWAVTTRIPTTCSGSSTKRDSWKTKATCRCQSSLIRFLTGFCCRDGARRRICSCRSAFLPVTWLTRACAWSRST